MRNIDELVSKLTLEEKASLCSGLDFWHTKPVDRLGIPSVMVSDGPNGLRTQKADSDHLGLGKAETAVCFPTGSALGASFDKDLAYELGASLARAAKGMGLHTVLGPAVNMKRSPLCGRNFEYISEDPCVAGNLGVGYVRGMQDNGVGVCVKHFAANNQEYCRMSTDTIVSERALREIYLAAFEMIVRKSHPWSVMCAYNRLNGTYCCENSWLLDSVLRKEWGFDGIVITDWGAMNDRCRALEAGLELEMPSSSGLRDSQIVTAVRTGKLDEAVLDRAVSRLLTWVFRPEDHDSSSATTLDEQHALARKMADASAVLLKNDDSLLPLEKKKEAVFIGTFAASTRYQGGGSSHVSSYRVSTVLDSARSFAGISYYPGWGDDAAQRDAGRLEDAVRSAAAAERVVVFAGLPDSWESEGSDRAGIGLPPCQDELIERIAEVQKNIVVVLFSGSPVSMPWIDKVSSVLQMNLAGEAAGESCAGILFGDVNPSGHLAETYPLALEDNPSYLSFPGSGKKVVYREDVFVGYRWYDSLQCPVLFPFGHGLSYTTFSLSGARLDGRRVSAVLTNTGKRAGAQVVQVYVRPPRSAEDRPVHELVDFTKVMLEPGESRTVEFVIDDRMLSYYSSECGCWTADGGEYVIELAFSSRDIRQTLVLRLETEQRPFVLCDHTTVRDLLAFMPYEKLPGFVKEARKCFGVGSQVKREAMDDKASLAMFMEMPLHSITSFVSVPEDYLEEVRKLSES